MMSIAYNYAQQTPAAGFLAKPQQLLIDGRRVPSAAGRTFKSLNPATEQVIATIAEGNEFDVDHAVAAARRAFEGRWRTMRAAERGHILLKWAELLKQHADEIVELESLDAGKPIAAVLRQDFPAALDTLTYYAGWADKISGDVIATRDDALTYTVREPVGVVAAIVPWNFPLMIGMWKLAPALASGCTVVMKPAELTSLSALRVGELAHEAGLPPGVLNIVPGPGRTVGDALVNHPDVDKVTFTGSPGVGRGIMKGAAGNFKRVSLELGGKSANVILPMPTWTQLRKPRRPASFSTPDRCARPARACWFRRRFTMRWSSDLPHARRRCAWAIRWIGPRRLARSSPKSR